jgi:hypothetical protein
MPKPNGKQKPNGKSHRKRSATLGRRELERIRAKLELLPVRERRSCPASSRDAPTSWWPGRSSSKS